MTEKISFRQEAESENLDANKKNFLSILPAGSGYTFLFFVLLIAFIISMLFVVKLPVKINGDGYFVSGHKQIPVSFNKDNYLIEDILFEKGQKLSFGQEIMRLSQTHLPGNDILMSNLSSEIHRLQLLIGKKESRLIDLSGRHEDMMSQQDTVILTISKQLWSLKKNESDAKEYFEKGLSNKKEWQAKKEATQSIRIRLEESKQLKITMIQDYNNSLLSIESEIDSLQSVINEKQKELDTFQDVIIKSPCDCYAGEIFANKNSFSEKERVLATLLLNNPGKSAHIYIPSYQFKPIDEGASVLIKPSAYPSLKYGVISGKVTSVSETTLSGKHYPELFKATSNYFKVNVEVTSLPEAVKLQSGMQFDGEIIIQHLTLFQFIFE